MGPVSGPQRVDLNAKVSNMRLLVTLAMVALSCVPSTATAQRGPAARAVEDIYIARSVRTSRVMPTDFCAESRVGFGSTFEDLFNLHATTTRTSDGRMTEALGDRIGQLRVCVGRTSNPLRLNFYAEGDLGAVAFTGKGDCEAPKLDFPEPGITVYRCFLDLTDLPRGYTGGLLTTNTVASRQLIGATSDPAGYVQSSIATVRLWKQR